MSKAKTTSSNKTPNTFYHFVGKPYTPDSFVKEAQKFGVTRRIAANQLKGMNFGDKIIFLVWRGKNIPPAVIGEMRISSVHFDGETNAKVVEELKSEEKIVSESAGSGAVIQRACGSFIDGGSCSLREDVAIGELVEKAEKATDAQQEKNGIKDDDRASVWAMVGGHLDHVYIPPRTLTGDIKFSRGFGAWRSDVSFQGHAPVAATLPPNAVAGNAVGGVENYQRRKVIVD